ncbi:MAG: transglutaminaseTgpA domain-containing protein [Bacteroidota bacterium]
MQTLQAIPRRSWDWPLAILLFLLLQVAAARLVITDWTPYLFFTQTLSAFSVALGLALGYSRFSPRLVRWLAFLYSLVVLPWQMTVAVEAEASFSERLAVVGGRLWFSLVEFFTRKPVEDGLFFVAIVSLAFWIVGLTAGYAFTRYNNTLGALIPAGVATLIVQLYDGFVPLRIWGLALYLFLALLYVGRIYLKQNRKLWDDRRVLVTAESTQDIGRSLLLLAAVTVFLAWSLPTSLSSLKSAARTWERLARPVRERLHNAVVSLESPYGSGTQSEFYGENLFLGQNAASGDAPVFTVSLSTPPQQMPPRFYWRGRVYDTYINGHWTNSNDSSADFDPRTDEVSLPIAQDSSEEARFTFTVQFPRQALLYTPANPFWVNRPSRVFSLPTPGRDADLFSWIANPALSGGDKYQVRSWILNPTIEDLRAAGTDYPAWIKARYLPTSAPDALLNSLAPLALQASQGKETPYDKAEAITAYLRGEIRYSTRVAAPPRGVDPTLWVLNDYKRGFCLYYASAEVLMLRSIGIPARMAVGFAQGTLNKDTGVYTIQQHDAHAWPEVYFPGIGWVEFEPTGNQDPLVRPAAPQITPTPIGGPGGLNGGLLNGQDPTDRQSRLNDEGVTQPVAEQTRAANGMLMAISLVLAGVLLFAGWRFGLAERLPAYISTVYVRNGMTPPAWLKRWERWMHLGSIERSFHAINYSLRSLGKPQAVHITPSERAAVLEKMLPAAAPAIGDLLSEHMASMYTPHPGSPVRARRAAWILVGHTLRERVRRAWNRFDRRFDRYG